MRFIGFAAHAEATGGLFGECCGPTDRDFLAVDGGDTFTVAVGADGRVVGWGSAFYGELGANDQDKSSFQQLQMHSTELGLPVPCVSVTCGLNHVLALSASGQVFAWGWNRYGQIGQPIEEESMIASQPIQVPLSEPVRVTALAAGGTHSLAVDDRGRVWSWGGNDFGQLGRPSKDPNACAMPSIVSMTSRAQDVAAGWAHSALVTTDGDLFTFGWGLYHQLGHGSTQNESSPRLVQALEGVDVSPLGRSGVVQVACGNWHTAVRTAHGDVYTFGWGQHGQLGHANATSQALPRVVTTADGYFDSQDQGHEAVAIACGSRQTLVLCANGDVHWWGSSRDKLKASRSSDAWGRLPTSLKCERIASGSAHVLLLASDRVTK